MAPAMFAFWSIATSIAATPNVGIRIDRVESGADNEARAIAQTLASSIAAWTGGEAVVGAPGTIMVSIVVEARPEQLVVVAELVRRDARKLMIELQRDRGSWASALQPIVQDFFPIRGAFAARATRTATPSVALAGTSEPAPAPAEVWKPWPWIAIGTGAVLAGAGVAFAVSGANARDRLRGEPLAPSEMRELQGTMDDRTLAANLLIAGAIAAAGTGIALFFLD